MERPNLADNLWPEGYRAVSWHASRQATHCNTSTQNGRFGRQFDRIWPILAKHALASVERQLLFVDLGQTLQISANFGPALARFRQHRPNIVPNRPNSGRIWRLVCQIWPNSAQCWPNLGWIWAPRATFSATVSRQTATCGQLLSSPRAPGVTFLYLSLCVCVSSKFGNLRKYYSASVGNTTIKREKLATA